MIRTCGLLPLVGLLVLFYGGGCTPQRGIYHTVSGGESLSGIARTYGQNEINLARINNIAKPSQLKAGEKIFIPNANKEIRVAAPAKTVPVSAPAAAKSAEVKTAVKAKEPPPDKKAEAVTKAKKSSPPAVAPGRFGWPLRGEILRRFGETKPYPCKGIEIAAKPGTPVLSAAAGRVIYSDDGIRSFGNMVIIKHDDDFFSVYAFNQRNLVASGSFVSQGEKIALSGTPSTGDPARLYFEIRYHKEPVDPTFYLPSL